MKILLASSEVFPFSKTGGLADMVGSLGLALVNAGQQARIVTPLYRGLRDKFPHMTLVNWQFDLPVGGRNTQADLWELDLDSGLKIYFVDQPEYFDRAGIYQEGQFSYADNAERYIFFSKCVANLARYLPWQADVVHLHDWQVGLVPALIRHDHVSAGWGNPPPTCLTIHNLAYQGIFPADAYALTNLPKHFFNTEGAEYFGMLNCLKAGIAFADAITTVSPRYAREITTEELGCGLDGILRRRREHLQGILNGVDYQEWNPAKDVYLTAPFSASKLAGKKINKAAVQKFVALPVAEKIPLY